MEEENYQEPLENKESTTADGVGAEDNTTISKDKASKKSAWREWVEAMLIALLIATVVRVFAIEAYVIPTPSMEKTLLVGDYVFVNKLAYGSRMPITPMSMPFTHNTFSNGKKSYVESVQLPYFRMPGFNSIKRNDVVVFNFPMEDERPIDKRINFIKRCVALPNDTLTITNKQILINGDSLPNPIRVQFDYFIRTNGEAFNKNDLLKLGITSGGQQISSHGNLYKYTLSDSLLAKMKSLKNVTEITPILRDKGIYDVHNTVFPQDLDNFPWNIDNYGSLVVPAQGTTVNIDTNNIALYHRIIDVYESNELIISEGTIFINGVERSSYTFKQNYYFVLGDNRHDSDDSRYWGFVPEDHIVGKAWLVWLSLKEYGTFFDRIRWERLFMNIHHE